MKMAFSDNNIGVFLKDDCTGCTACIATCSQGAISITEDMDGFIYPYIEREKCINCGRCINVCPISNKEYNKSDVEVYAVQADDSIRRSSSSGGAFSIIAEWFIKSGGVVFGAELSGDRVVHVMIDKTEDLNRIRKSKYIQSDISDCFCKIKKLLDSKKNVMFVGTPCQCEGVLRYCRNHEKLLLVDLLCMGVPPQSLFSRYISEELGDVEEFSFRDKEVDDWGGMLYYSYKKNGKRIRLSAENSSYYTAFLEGYSLRPSCYRCKYTSNNRRSDITIGDFWGIENINKDFQDKKGTSMVIISTTKGKKLWGSISVPKQMKIENAKGLLKNQALIHPERDRGKRKEFYERIKSQTIKDAVYAIKGDKAQCGIINWWWEDDNGAILTAYALQQTISAMGYTSRLIDFKTDNNKYGISDKFSAKHLYVTSPIVNEEDYKRLNDCFDTFIVGSDQVFRAEWVSDHWFLDFADDNKTKIAIAASFGTNKLNISKLRKSRLKYLLSRFNAVSVREEQGVSLCKELGRKSAHIIDPVFYLDYKDYLNNFMIDERKECEEKYIFVYIRDESDYKKRIIDSVLKELNVDKVFYANDKTEVEEFVEKIYYSSFVVSDSYHGICFSIIFNKCFVCLINNMRGAERFNSLLNTYKLEKKRFVTEGCECNIAAIVNQEIDWESINSIIDQEKEKGINWIRSSLIKNTKVNKLVCSVRKYNYEKLKNRENSLRLDIREKKLRYWEKHINNHDDMAICFGAGLMGEKFIEENSHGGRNVVKIAFFLDNKKGKYWIDKYPVYSLHEVSGFLNREKKIIITTSEDYKNEIYAQLSYNGFHNIELYSVD